MYQHLNHGVLEGEETEQELENLFEEIMTENFPNLMKEIDIQVQELQRVTNQDEPTEMDAKRLTRRHSIIKMPKVKYKENLKSSKRKWLSMGEFS